MVEMEGSGGVALGADFSDVKDVCGRTATKAEASHPSADSKVVQKNIFIIVNKSKGINSKTGSSWIEKFQFTS